MKTLDKEPFQDDIDRYQMMINSAPIGISMTRDEIILSVNPFLVQMFGYNDLEELQGKSVSMLFPSNLRELMIKRNLNREKGKPEPSSYQFTGLRKDGTIFPIYINVKVMKWPEGFTTVAFVQDITEQREFEQRHMENEKRYRAMFENTPEAILILDYDLGKFVEVNERAEKFFRMKAKDLMKIGLSDISPKYQANGRLSIEYEIEGLTKTLDGEKPIIDWILQDSEGIKINCEVRLANVSTKNKNLVRVSIIDNEEKIQSANLLRESEAKYRTLVESAPEAIIVYNNDTGKFVDANENMAILIGVEKEKIFHMTPPDLYGTNINPNETSEAIQNRINRVLSGQEVLTEVIVKHISGKKIPCELRMVKLPSAKGSLIRGSFIDITPRKNAEKELQIVRDQLFQAQKIEAIGRIAGGIAHDFNNLLTIITGYSKLMLFDLDPKDAIYEYIEKINEASETGAMLTKQLLSFSRKRILKPKIMNITELLHKLGNLISSIIPSNFEFELNIVQNLKNVKIDPSQIEQVIMNLAINSKDAMPDGGKIILRANNLENRAMTSLDTSNDYIHISLEDTGVGMSEETLSKVFEPFFTTKPVDQGTGLGLATAYGIISQSGGIITVESDLGKGTVFHIYLPVVYGNELNIKDQSKRKIAKSLSTKKTILLVDDDVTIRHLLEEILSRNNYVILGATTPEDAIKISDIYEDEIDLLLTDIIMPNMNGLEMSKKIKEKRKDIKILFITGYSNLDIVNEIKEGGYDIIEKPFTPTDLTSKIIEYFRFK